MTATPDKTAADAQQIIAELERKLDERTSERDEALEQQTATADILKIIASSPSDVQPVFEAIATSTKRLIGGFSTTVFSIVDDVLHLSALTPTSPAADAALKARFPAPLSAQPWAEQIRIGEIVNVADIETESAVPANVRDVWRMRGFRALLLVPLLRDRASIGMISLTRKEPGTFAAHHVQLLQTFADQAVIAIENARLFNETQEALERQTATADILRVISESPTDVQPVFQAIAEHARLLSKAQVGATTRLEGDMVHLAAVRSMSADADEAMRSSFPMPLKLASPNIRRAIMEQVPIQIPDVHLDSDYAHLVDGTHRMGFRSIMSVPLMHEGRSIGTIGVAREEPGLFPVAAVTLLQAFADQAVIAIENVRLFEEVQAKTRDLSEALTYQTSSANILKVIASTPTDVEPALKAIVESACELCEAYDAAVVLQDGEYLRFSAHHGPIPIGLEKWPINRHWTAGRAFIDQRPVHIHDLRDEAHTELSDGRELALRMGHRTILSVPLLREGDSIGAIALRRTEVHPFSDKQISLLQTFADQAVIAIANVRLFEQVQERTRELSKSLDDLRAAQDRLVQTEKLASLGQLTAGIAHEIKNPLNFVNNFSSLSAELIDELDETLAPAPLDQKMRGEVGELTQMLKSNLEKVVEHGKRADSIVKNMLLHSRQGSGEHRPVDINTIVDESLNLAYHGARAEKTGFNITMQRNFDPAVGMADVYPQEITRVLLNLISNGFYATAKRKMAAGDGFEPMLSATTRNLSDKVEIRIRDNGTGIPPDFKEKIFNPFFTTKPAGEGTGLGLSMSHDIIVKQHGGTIEVETEPGQFTEFKIVLPRTGQM
jgi:two-component system NtrC family sensor kinase